MKKTNIIYWISTAFIFLFEGVVPALTSQSELAKEGIRHLGYPTYFGIAFTIFKVLGAIVLIVPRFPPRVKEWAYAGFTFDFIIAFISNISVDGFTRVGFLPLVIFAILIISYISYHKKQPLYTRTVNYSG